MKLYMKPLFWVLIAAFGFTGCDSLQQTNKLKSFETASGKWKTSNFTDYEFVWEKSCFCAFRGPSLVVVENNKVVQVLNPETRQPRTGIELELFQTIDELMAWIEEESDRKPELLKVEYDSTYGYPVSIQYDYSKMIADDEFLATVKNLKKR